MSLGSEGPGQAMELVRSVFTGFTSKGLTVLQGEYAAVKEVRDYRLCARDETREVVRVGIYPLLIGPVVTVSDADQAKRSAFRPIPNLVRERASEVVSVHRRIRCFWHGSVATSPVDRIGNWGDEERTAELHEFLIEPIAELGLRALVHGVRYPKKAVAELKKRYGIEYGGWLPNFAVPEAFAQATLTVHIPRRPYVESLPGIPTIRPFEALACGIPLVSASWEDSEDLFAPGQDFLLVRDGKEMKTAIKEIMKDRSLRSSLAEHGLRAICARHTCAHRVDELMTIYEDVNARERRIVKENVAAV